jgi:hypothetical protein
MIGVVGAADAYDDPIEGTGEAPKQGIGGKLPGAATVG